MLVVLGSGGGADVVIVCRDCVTGGVCRCGYCFGCRLTQELLGAFTAWMEEKDIELRREDEKNALAIGFHLSMSYHCDVLTAGAWPISSTSAEANLLLPPEVEAHMALFTKFYTERSSGRKLLWVHHCSYGTVQSHCFEKRHEFALSFYQILILLLVRPMLLLVLVLLLTMRVVGIYESADWWSG